MPKSFEFSLRVYAEDTDYGGVVYHSNYLNFMERARTELLASVSLDVEYWANKGLFFVVRHADVGYVAPAKLNALLVVETQVERVRGSSITFKQRIVNKENPEASLCEATLLLVCVNSDIRPVRVPDELREAIA